MNTVTEILTGWTFDWWHPVTKEKKEWSQLYGSKEEAEGRRRSIKDYISEQISDTTFPEDIRMRIKKVDKREVKTNLEDVLAPSDKWT